jgi:hypothetical protein
VDVLSASGQVSPGDGSAAATLPRRPAMLTWQGVSSPRLESVRLLLAEERLRASGRVIASATGDGAPYSASFELTVNAAGVVSRLLLRSSTAEDERQVSLNRSEDGVWLVDHGSGVERTEFGGAVDVDVEGLVLFNTLPLRRLGLHRMPGDHDLPVVFVSLPDLSSRLVRQNYRTVSVGDHSSVVHYSCDAFEAELTVDVDGLVLEYPGLSRRV